MLVAFKALEKDYSSNQTSAAELDRTSLLEPQIDFFSFCELQID
jgi:hypothetical protein